MVTVDQFVPNSEQKQYTPLMNMNEFCLIRTTRKLKLPLLTLFFWMFVGVTFCTFSATLTLNYLNIRATSFLFTTSLTIAYALLFINIAVHLETQIVPWSRRIILTSHIPPAAVIECRFRT